MRRITPVQRSRVFVGITIGVLAVLFAGCAEGERGIFATIAIEEEIKKNNLVENASVTGLVRTEFNGTEFFVTLAGTKIFTRPAAGNDWDEISAPGSSLAQFVAGRDTASPGTGDNRGIAEEVYAVYQGSSSQANVLYRLTDSLSWEVAYTPTSGDRFIDGMIGVEELLLVNTDGGELLVWNTAISDTVITNRISSGFNGGIRDAVKHDPDDDGNFEVYIIGESGLLVEVDDITGTPVVTEFTTTNSSPQPVGIGVAPFDGGILAVTDKDGSVYISGSSEPATGAAKWDNAGGVGRPASDIVWVEELNNNSGGFLISTTSDAIRNESGRGYYEGTITGSAGDYSISVNNELGNNYEASDLAVASINQLRYYNNGVVFALTDGLGLWSTVYSADSNLVWRWE